MTENPADAGPLQVKGLIVGRGRNFVSNALREAGLIAGEQANTRGFNIQHPEMGLGTFSQYTALEIYLQSERCDGSTVAASTCVHAGKLVFDQNDVLVAYMLNSRVFGIEDYEVPVDAFAHLIEQNYPLRTLENSGPRAMGDEGIMCTQYDGIGPGNEVVAVVGCGGLLWMTVIDTRANFD